MSPFEDATVTVALQMLAGHRSQAAEQHVDGTNPADHAVMAMKPIRAASPVALVRVRILLL
jgi:hypothetical protein